MKAYVIADVEVKDPDHYPEYTSQVEATIHKFGGRFIARGGGVEVLEGKWQPHRIVIIEFPDMAALRGWYRSTDYAPLIGLRQKYSDGSLICVQGV
ncbi:MAG: DUF1330 domain-containing protein [Candidatus Eremiobacteraeota bacterium]|nr:DUF1330 domain-containing protein [Candidatus Eremiobacteraeota bacterium]MBV8355541.1 DUF1330 domain-containing protein [Candidatus Eremiobacteraeota bacterium]